MWPYEAYDHKEEIKMVGGRRLNKREGEYDGGKEQELCTENVKDSDILRLEY